MDKEEIKAKKKAAASKAFLELRKDFRDTFNTPHGKRVLEHLYNSVTNDCSDNLNPYAIMRKDACLHLITVYIKNLTKEPE